ncbi:MAG: SAM-dependent methyltransferase [Clostridia bacterium]|nr:SAM-dependent methyltransferase [Clostridia bacterium]
MSVDNRLKKIAGMIRVGSTVADIGTDHAYLPVFLVRNKIAVRAFACDVSDGPLDNARATVENAGVDNIIIRKGDGLAAVAPSEADTFVIAGMGGDLIARILEAALWVKDARYELILQPMTAVEDLREYLCNNGFQIVMERAVKAQGRVYTVMKAVYTGEKLLCDPLFYFVGKLGENLESDELEYITRKRRIIAKLADDIKSIESKKEKYAVLCEALLGIDRLIGNKDGN